MWARRAPPRIAILMYHGFRDGKGDAARREGDGKFTSAGELERHIRICREYGTVISLSQAISGAALPRNPIVLTFDDGYLNNWTVAFPLLRKHAVPATIFLTTGFLDDTIVLWIDRFDYLFANAPEGIWTCSLGGVAGSLDLRNVNVRSKTRAATKDLMKKLSLEEINSVLTSLEEEWGIKYERASMPEPLRPLKWDHVRAMAATGLVEFGAHTVSHPILSRCPRDIQAREISGSKRRVEEELDRPCVSFAYPNGRSADFTDDTTEIVRSCGFKAAVTTDPGFASPSCPEPLLLPRWGISRTEFDLACLLAR